MSDSEHNEEDTTAFTISEDLVQSPTHKAASTTDITFDGLLTEHPLKIHEDLTGGNGGQAWPAGHVLAKYLLRQKREEMKGASTIVELGAGGGLVGLAIALGCQPHGIVYVTDLAPMQTLMQQNIALNGLEGRVEASVYDWGSARPASLPAHPDIVLAADCVYFEPAFPLLLQTMRELIGARTVCYFCFKRRRRADMQFLIAAKKTFIVEDVVDDPDREIYARENIHLCEIRRKTNR